MGWSILLPMSPGLTDCPWGAPMAAARSCAASLMLWPHVFWRFFAQHLPDDIMELLDFVLSTTYFSYDGRIYKQIQGVPMGSPMSVVVSNLSWTIHSKPKEMKLKIWKRCVDDIFEIIKHTQRDPFTAHLNSIDHTGSMLFTDEPAVDKAIPFLQLCLCLMSMVGLAWPYDRQLEKAHTRQNVPRCDHGQSSRGYVQWS